MNEAWICPSCKRGVAAGEKTCDHGGGINQHAMPLSQYTNVPQYQNPGWGWRCGCPPGHICQASGCPRGVLLQGVHSYI